MLFTIAGPTEGGEKQNFDELGMIDLESWWVWLVGLSTQLVMVGDVRLRITVLGGEHHPLSSTPEPEHRLASVVSYVPMPRGWGLNTAPEKSLCSPLPPEVPIPRVNQ